MRTVPAISRQKLFGQLEYEPHSEEQWNAHESMARFRAACCGRRWGKSTWAGKEMTLKMFVPDSVNWIVGPNYGLGEKEFRIVYQDFKKMGLLKYCNKSYNVKQGNMRIHFKELNALLEVKSAEQPDSLVGEGLDHVIMSEAAKHKMSTWQMYIEPALSDKLGSADFPSTPEGFNWFKGLFDMGQSEGQRFSDYDSWRFPTWTNALNYPGGFNSSCPNIIDGIHQFMHKCECNEELVRIFNTVSRTYWLQEYGAEFTAFEGMIYDEFNETIHVKSFEYQPAWKNWWTLDFGFTDPFICIDIMIDPSDRVWIWREYVVTSKSTHDHGLILKNRTNPPGFHVDAIAADPRGADEIATLAFMLGAIQAHDVGWVMGIEAVKRQMKVRADGLPGLIIHPSCTETIRQFKALRAKETKEGHNAKIGQHDYDDHCPDAIRYFHNEYFVLGANGSLADVYSGYQGTEAAGFFTYASGVTIGEPVTYGYGR